MKKINLLIVLIFLAISIQAQKLVSVPISSTAPLLESKMLSVSRDSISVKAAMKKNGIVVIFSCNTCPYVIKNQQRNNEIAEHALKNDVGVIIINSNEALRQSEDSYKSMQIYAKQQKYNWHYTVDNNSVIADAYGATRTPEVFLLNASGKVMYKGAIDDNPSDAENVTRQHLKIAIDEMVSNKNITVKESKSVGCSIKRLK
jgi:peroxiredoxin